MLRHFYRVKSALRFIIFYKSISKRGYTLALCYAGLFLTPIESRASFLADAGSIKGTVKATGAPSSNINSHSTLLSGVRLTLVNRDIPTQSFKSVTDETGSFIFINLPAANYTLTAESDGLPSVTRDIHLSAGATLVVEIELTASISESVTVREEEGLLSTSETTTSNTLRSETLKNMPLRAENYQSALLLTPGVVRGNDGLDHLKGARAGQSAYTVNGADVTDPVTGTLAFDIPIEAASSVQIEENPYGAEFGRFTGGVTNLETKGGGDKFKIGAARFFPTFRNILSGPVDSFRPRVTFSGPLWRDRLFFLQSFEYRFTRVRVPSLAAPFDDSTSESFNSFTQLDLVLNKNNRVKAVGSIFPQKIRYAGLNTFNPHEVTPNIKQRGALLSISEQAIFGDASFLSSELNYKTFDVDVFAQGWLPLTLLPDVNTGNFFADTRRRTKRWQWQETYYARPFKLWGQHSLKVGAEYDYTDIAGQFNNQPILIRRLDNTLAQRIDFTRPATSGAAFNASELAAFVQNHWVARPSLTIDAGLRFDRDTLTRQSGIAPRVAFMFLPLKNDRTIIRGGAGIFYDRAPYSAGYFAPLGSSAPASSFAGIPERIVTRFAPDGVTLTDGPRLFNNQIEGQLRRPRSLRWSLQLDRGLTKTLTTRVGFLQRTTTDDQIIEPRLGPLGAGGTLALTSSGRSKYRELQLLANYNAKRLGNWNVSYTWSRARGDLNTIDNFLGDLPAFVIRPNEYRPLPFDAPHRFLFYGSFNTRYDINISPTLEIRSGFPFSKVNEQLDFIGPRNQAGRFPTYFSLDTQVTKGFLIPKFESHKARIGVAVFNITNHFNPRDVQQNITSPQLGQFFNSLGTSVRGKFELDF